ncbi:class I adenylate-forming enzyme family protein [Brevibacillus reuszeri]|uniref:class I adenylate-forming enzyme family protein n=1 Tax=Brevibacillus reuszeri TaxID=54915 RepID=UPI00289FADED|nr:AMP-binding protein [Brevibacillus reuszeri]
MNVSALLAANGRKFPNKPALIAGEDEVSFSLWDDMANRWACHLREQGVAFGDRVILMMPNCLEFAFMYIAVIRCGAIVVPINARSTQEEVRYICEHAQATALVVHEALVPAVNELVEENGKIVAIKTGKSQGEWVGTADWSLEEITSDKLAVHAIDPEANWATEDTEVSILYTSGTTGRPKGVLFTHRSLLTVAKMMSIEMGMTHRSRVLQLMPLSHSAPLHLFFIPALMLGATQVSALTFSPELLLSLVQKHKITHFFGAPVAYLLTMKHPAFSQFDLSSVECWIYGGAPLSKEMAEHMEQAYGRDKLACVYGLTEAGPTGTCLFHREHPDKVGSIGNRSVLFAEIEVVNESGEKTAAGEGGEIRVRGEGTMKSYYNNPEATSETLRDGWIYTGDIGRMDEDGFLWIVDRKKDVMITGGINVYPKEIELQLERHPAIQEVAVVGLPHPEWGETITAYVVLRPDTEGKNDWNQEIRDFLGGRLADYKLPRQVVVLPALPRNSSGKILKHSLRDTHSLQGVE